MGSFRVLEHTGEVGIEAQGATLGAVFAQTARGMFSLMVELEAIRERESRRVEVQAGDLDALLVAWLNELVFLFDLDGLLLARFQVEEIDQRRLKATCYGEVACPSRHQLKLGVKAATYHGARVRWDEGWHARVILDI